MKVLLVDSKKIYEKDFFMMDKKWQKKQVLN